MTMKKAILPAMISALFATSAQAATLYEIDDTAVSLTGEISAFYTVNDEKEDGDEVDENGVLYSEVALQFDVSTKVSDSVTAIGSFEVESKDDEDVDFHALKVDDAWLGFATDFGTVKLGETGSSYAVLEKTELSNESDEYGAGEYSDSEDDGRAVRYENTLGPVALSANYSFVGGNSGQGNDNFALSADYAVDDNFTIGTAYLNGDKTSSWGISGAVEVEGFYAAAVYTDNDEAEGDTDFTTKALSASYDFDLATVYGSYQMKEFDTNAEADLDYWYVGVSHDVTANISAFVEYSDTEADDKSYEASALIAGIYYAF
ncbi:porin [Psychromonas sp.]|uniref:porin n=1 Tax=Psychromonas sp. TaxID=1884585 RepID=UPI0035689D2E